MNKSTWFMLSLAPMLMWLPATAAPILASVSLTLPLTMPGIDGPSCCYVKQDFSVDYELLMTGGSGTGMAILDVLLYANSNEGGMYPYRPWNDFGGAAEININGDSYWNDGGFNGYCRGYGRVDCHAYVPISFTFGTPEVLHMSGEASAFLSAMPDADLSTLGGNTIHAYVELERFFDIRATDGGTMKDVQVSFAPSVSVPEPWGCSIVTIGVALLFARRLFVHTL